MVHPLEEQISKLAHSVEDLPNRLGIRRAAFYIVAALATIGAITGPLALWKIDNGVHQENELHFNEDDQPTDAEVEAAALLAIASQLIEDGYDMPGKTGAGGSETSGSHLEAGGADPPTTAIDNVANTVDHSSE